MSAAKPKVSKGLEMWAEIQQVLLCNMAHIILNNFLKCSKPSYNILELVTVFYVSFAWCVVHNAAHFVLDSLSRKTLHLFPVHSQSYR